MKPSNTFIFARETEYSPYALRPHPPSAAAIPVHSVRCTRATSTAIHGRPQSLPWPRPSLVGSGHSCTRHGSHATASYPTYTRIRMPNRAPAYTPAGGAGWRSAEAPHAPPHVAALAVMLSVPPMRVLGPALHPLRPSRLLVGLHRGSRLIMHPQPPRLLRGAEAATKEEAVVAAETTLRRLHWRVPRPGWSRPRRNTLKPHSSAGMTG
jgi:hypothetical protein